MASAAIRPWRLAGPASGTCAAVPVTTSRISTASPTAQIAGSLVCMEGLTRMPPRGPTSRPASTASWFSGRTPTPRITRSAASVPPDLSFTLTPPSAASNASAESPSITATPRDRRASTIGTVISGSSGGSTCAWSSTTVVCTPRFTKFSASSRPMKPAPTTTTRFAPSSTRPLIRSTSARLRSVSTCGDSTPGIGGRSGAAPGARSRAS